MDNSNVTPLHPKEDDESILTRITAALSLIAYFEEQEIKWRPLMSALLLEYDGI